MSKSYFLLPVFALCSLTLSAQKAASAWISTGTVRALLTEEGPLVSSFEAGISGQNQELISEISLWMGAVDPAQNLMLSIQQANPELSDFQGGFRDVPFSAGVWKVTKAEIIQHLNDYLDNGVIDNPIPAIFAWPGKGNPYSEQYNGFSVDEFPRILTAPFSDRYPNPDYEYNPAAGDFPYYNPPINNIDPAPDEIVYVPFHVKRLSHAFPGTGIKTISLDCSAVFFTYYCDDAEFLDHTVFGYANLGNPPGAYVDSFFTAFNIDGNVGSASDDYLGSLPITKAAYFYNADTAVMANGLFPPVVGFDINVGVVNEVGHSQDVNSVMPLYPANANVVPSISFPQLPIEYYRYITAHWRDGQPMTLGGMGYGGTMVTEYVYNGIPGLAGEWSELQAQNPPGDRRALISSGPGIIPKGAYNRVLFSMSFVPGDRSLSSQLKSLKEYSFHISNFFYADYFPPAINPYDTLPCFRPTSTTVEQEKTAVKIYPNPVHGLLQIDAGEAEIQSVQIVDLLGRQVLEQQFPSRGVNSVQIETGMLQPGIYVLKGKLRNHGLFVQKLVKR